MCRSVWLPAQTCAAAGVNVAQETGDLMPFSDAHPNRGRLLVIGGSERQDPNAEILGHFMQLAGDDARLLVCAAASREPAELLEEYDYVFRELGAAEVWGEALQDRHACEDPQLLDRLRQASAVFLTGGDQFRLTSTIAGTSFSELLQTRFEESGLPIAGTSAGATALGSTMLMGGPAGGRVRQSDVNVGVGLGYLRETIVDSHFNERSRINRLLTVFAQNPQILGLGIDENTAIDLVPGQPLRVLGTGAVTVLEGRLTYSNAADVADEEVIALSGVTLHVLPRGYGFDARARQLIIPQSA